MSNITETTKNFAMDLHTVLQKSMVAVPEGAKPNSVVSLLMPGQSVDENDFYFPPDDAYPDFEVKKAEMSVLVNSSLKLDAVYSPTQNNISTIYGNIVSNAQLPKSDEWSASEKKKFDDANYFLNKNVETYIRYQNLYDIASEQYWIEKMKKSRNSREKEFKRKMDSILTLWEANKKQEYEQNQNIVREMLKSSPANYFRAVEANMKAYSGDKFPATFLPSGWAINDDGLSWTRMSFSGDEGSQSTVISQEEKTILKEEIYKKTGFFESIFRLFRPSPVIRKDVTEIRSFTETINNRVDFKSFSLKCELARVNVYREWMDLGVLSYQSAKLAGLKEGAISTGKLSADNNGSMPSYISALVLAKNIEMSMNLDEEGAKSLNSMLDERGTPKQKISCGSFEVSEKSTVKINKNEKSRYDNKYEVTISCPGKQIIGFVNTLVPYFPYISG